MGVTTERAAVQEPAEGQYLAQEAILGFHPRRTHGHRTATLDVELRGPSGAERTEAGRYRCAPRSPVAGSPHDSALSQP